MRAITRAAPRADVYELALRAGHFGLVVGSTARETTWPAVAGWTRWRAGEGELPERDRAASSEDEPDAEAPGVGTRLGVGLELAAGVGAALARSLAGAASRTVGGVRVLAEEVTGQLPRLARLGRLAPGHPGLARTAARRAGARRPGAPSSSSSRTAPTATPPSSGASTTSSAGCSRSASARASTSAC